ncbi:MAG: Cytochrome c oxidase, cbb3-type, CcoQ subunit [uncultured Sulfurovum sp.]|uniref:Cytochrome c oxidase, cbb3-type, CcoQ subunit n=1 Tax=uncultured Sulfurovum sp. TaxID=269237 RepID=A0A6S6SI13_9BACT|nr:MAG: Cytochrome c oxidase, cbb3-type, CcoQ subunit [uncultured Sulfurovum sp.]
MDIQNIQGYGMFFLTIFLTIILYWYIVYLYRSEKKGERDFEKYGRIALDDNIDSPPVEDKVASERDKKTKEQN